MALPRVVIVGGGFAGLEAAKLFKDEPVHVTLIDRRNFHLFQPLLYQVATGGLSPADICAPIRAVLRKAKNVETLLGEVTGFDLAARKVLLADGEIPYDTLIVCAGARHHYFGNEQWEAIAPGLKTIEDATAIRRKILAAFEHAEREPDLDHRRAWLTFVVVGGGPTGVELAGTLGEIANDTLKDDFRNFRPEEARILLLDAGERILSNFPEELSHAAEKDLLRLGVRCLNKRKVTSLDETGVSLTRDGEAARIEARTVIWAAGVKASPLGALLATAAGTTVDRGGRLTVTPECTLPGFPQVFVLGDMAAFEIEGSPGKTLPGVAPVAMQQGRYAARVILNRLAGRTVAPFKYIDKGNLATIGRHSAVADIRGFHLTGWFAWMTWLFVHLMYLVGFQNRLQVMLHWAFQYLTFNRNARLITSPGVTHEAETGS